MDDDVCVQDAFLISWCGHRLCRPCAARTVTYNVKNLQAQVRLLSGLCHIRFGPVAKTAGNTAACMREYQLSSHTLQHALQPACTHGKFVFF